MAGAPPRSSQWYLPKAFRDKPHIFPADTAVKGKEGTTIPCSKLHLAASSDYFERLFCPSHPTAPQDDETSVVDLSEFTEEELQFALCYINNRDASFRTHLPSFTAANFSTTARLLTRLMVFADRYQVKGLCRAAHAALLPRMTRGFEAAACILEAAGELAVGESPPMAITWALETVQKAAFAPSRPGEAAHDPHRHRVLLRVPKSVALMVLASHGTAAEEEALYRLALELAFKHEGGEAFLQQIRPELLPGAIVKDMLGTRFEAVLGADRLQAALGSAAGQGGQTRLPLWVRGTFPERFLPSDHLKSLAACAASERETPILSSTLASPSRLVTARAEGSTTFYGPVGGSSRAKHLLSAAKHRLDKLAAQGVLNPAVSLTPLASDVENFVDGTGRHEFVDVMDYKGNKALWCGAVPADCHPSCEVAVGVVVQLVTEQGRVEKLFLFKSDDTKTQILLSDYTTQVTDPMPPRGVLQEFPVRLLQPGCHFRVEFCQLQDAEHGQGTNVALVVDEPRDLLADIEEPPLGLWRSTLDDPRLAVWEGLQCGGSVWCTATFYSEVTNGRIVLHGAK